MTPPLCDPARFRLPTADRSAELSRRVIVRVVTSCLLVWLSALRLLQAQDDASLRRLEEQAIKSAVSQVAPSVVRIETLGGLERVNGVLIGAGPTTGVVVDEEGYVLSSAFNFAQMPSSILVTLPSGKRAAAEIVARDQSKMLVLLKIKTDEPLTVPAVVPRDELTVGQWAIAVGRTFAPEHPNLSVGVLSAKNRIWGKAIQADAKISPSNYGGPLIDIQGRVLGILVPLSPQQQGEMAGAEWYDSGIGFAIPLEEILPKLETLKRGEDLQAGVLGIGLEGKDLYSVEVKVAAVRPNSPAAEAGLQVGDVIIEANGILIRRQAELKHVIGPLYAGDSLDLKVRRNDEELALSAVLAAELVPYEHPFFGILPSRTRVKDGVAVRFVYPESPADQAGVQVGDVIRQWDEQDVTTADALRIALANLQPQQEVPVAWTRGDARGDDSFEKQVILASLPTTVPETLPTPSSEAPAEKPPAEKPSVGLLDVKLPEEANECFAYVPKGYHPDVPHGLAVLLHPPGGFQKEILENHWKDVAEERNLIVLAPQARDSERWNPTEVDFIRKTMTEMTTNYTVDASRVVVLGEQAGGAMAYLVALRHRDTVRGVAVADASLPRLVAIPDNEPLERLAFFIAYGENSRMAEAIQSGIEKLQDAKFPVTALQQPGEVSAFSASLRQQVARWIDTLDRL